MGRIWLAIRVFFRTLFDREIAERVDQVLSGHLPGGPQAPSSVTTSATSIPRQPPAAKAPEPAAAARSEALTLLAALQREARLVDLVKESLDAYSDAQVGAAARDVLRDSAKVLDRMFALEPILSESEGDAVEIPAGFDAGVFRLIGKVEGDPPFRGRLVHHGWRATHCQLPEWTGSQTAARVVAAAEVELP